MWMPKSRLSWEQNTERTQLGWEAAPYLQQIFASISRQELHSQCVTEELASLRLLLLQQHDVQCERIAGPYNEQSTQCFGNAEINVKPERQEAEVAEENSFATDLSKTPADEKSFAPALSKTPALSMAKRIKKLRSTSSVPDDSSVHTKQEVQDLMHAVHVKRNMIVVHPCFEITMGIVTLLNMASLGLHYQMKGCQVGYRIGEWCSNHNWSLASDALEAAEIVFNVFFIMELGVRLWVLRSAFIAHPLNVLDAVIVAVSSIDTFVFSPSRHGGGIVNVTALRIFRAFRVVRMVKILRFAESLREMHVILRTLWLSIRGVVWSVVLISGMILAGAIIMVQTSFFFLEDETISIETRLFLFDSFGTTTKAFMSMFESTFSGNWRNYSKPLIADVSYIFAFFWIPYVVLVNFVVMRVVAALFVKQTFAVADLDAERIAMEKLVEREKFAAEIRAVFLEADTSGDGAISKDEFDSLLHSSDIVAHFENVGLEIDEVIALFGVLSSDDGLADYEEMLVGAMKMKGSARAIDTVQIMHQQLQTHRALVNLTESLQHIRRDPSRG